VSKGSITAANPNAPNLIWSPEPTTFGTSHSLSRPVLRACLSGGREKLPVDFASCARFGEGDSNTASHHVWQIQPDGQLSEIAEGCEGFGAAHSLDDALLADLIVSIHLLPDGNLSRREKGPVLAARPE